MMLPIYSKAKNIDDYDNDLNDDNYKIDYKKKL